MANRIFRLFLSCLSMFSAVADETSRPAEIDYANAENWVLNDGQKAPDAGDFDVFYIYPTLVKDKDHPLMYWKDPKVVHKTRGFATAQTRGIFGDNVRVFAPFVRQLEFSRCRQTLKTGSAIPEGLTTGINDAINAFRHYWRHYRPQAAAGRTPRPLIFLGHSQGALDLYAVLKACPELSVENGWVASYLIGIPKLMAKDIVRDFAGRSILPAAGREDLGVIISWQTQCPEVTSSPFATPGGYGINPLNWRTDATPAPASANLGSHFYEWWKPGTPTRRETHFRGAVFSPEKGALLVDLPTNSAYDGRGILGEGIFHACDISLFAENLAENARQRVRCWQERFSRP